jgi:invasion protein IalB
MSEQWDTMSKRSFLAILLLSAGLAAPALAEDSAKKQDSHDAPGTTTKSFGAWSLHCQAAHEQGAEPRCVIAQTVQTASNKLLAVISIGRQHPSDPYNMVVTLPANVSFPSSVHIRTGSDDKWGVELPWQRCIPGACIAGAEMAQATLLHWSNLQSDGKIVFTAASGDEVGIPIGLRGFGDAYKALNP